MKKIWNGLGLFLCVGILFLGGGKVQAASAEDLSGVDVSIQDIIANIPDEEISKYDSMSNDEKNGMEISISEKYGQGDILSDEDSIFLVNLANERKNQDSNPMLRAGKTEKAFSKTLTKYSTKVTLSGTMHQNIAPVLGTSSYRGNVTLKLNSGSLKKVALATHHTAYAFLGWNGKLPSLGQVYKGSVSMSKTSSLSSTKMDKTTRYNGVLVFSSTMYTQATVTTSKGDVYTVTSDNWTRVH